MTRRAEIEAFVRGLGYQPLRLVMAESQRLTVYAAPLPAECDDRLEPHAWVHRISVERESAKVIEKARRWAVLPAQRTSETTLACWPDTNGWVGRQSVFDAMENKTRLLGYAERFWERLEPFLSPMSAEEFADQFYAWRAARGQMKSGDYVRILKMAIPFGVVLAGGKLSYLCVGTESPHVTLTRLAPDDEWHAALRTVFMRPYADKHKAYMHFYPGEDRRGGWGLFQVDVNSFDARGGIFVHGDLGVPIEPLSCEPISPLLADWYAAWMQREGASCCVWTAPDALTKAGRLDLDGVLLIALPADYAPVRIREIHLRPHKDTEAVLPYSHWYDICPIPEAEVADRGLFGVGVAWDSAELDRLTRDAVRAIPGGAGFGCATAVATSASSARQRIAKTHARIVPSIELPGFPQPPSGYERWFVLSDQSNLSNACS